MSKKQILRKTVDKLQKLDESEIKKADDFVDFLLTKTGNKELTKGIQRQAEEGKSFSFLKDEEELYSVDDLKETYNQ